MPAKPPGSCLRAGWPGRLLWISQPSATQQRPPVALRRVLGGLSRVQDGLATHRKVLGKRWPLLVATRDQPTGVLTV